MSNKRHSSRNMLVPGINRELMTIRSELVKRGLKLIQAHDTKKLPIRVLIGNHADALVPLFADIIQGAIRDKYDLIVMSSVYAEELLEHVQHHAFDIFILVLNNISFSYADNFPPEKRIEKALQLVSHFKAIYDRPVIALAGWPDGPSIEERAKHAGAEFFFRIPFSPVALQAVITQVLDKKPKGNTNIDRSDNL